MEWAGIAELAKELGLLPAVMLVYVVAQLRGVRAQIANLPCKGPNLREVPDGKCKKEGRRVA